MTKDKIIRIEFKLPTFEKKDNYQNLCKDLGLSVTAHLNSLVDASLNKRKELMKIKSYSQNRKEELINTLSIVDRYERDIKITLPKKLVDYTKFENSVLLERISNVLSLNKMNEAYKFCMGLINIIDSFDKPTQIIFTETDSKGRISTKLFRNVFGTAIIFVLLKAIDDGHKIFTLTDDLHEVYTEDLFELLSEGISTSIHERTKVYDNLFYEKYNKSHYNQWLQWSFGLSRRNPIKEFNRILTKNPKIMKPTSEDGENELFIRTQEAIKNLEKRYTLFGLTENGLKLAIEKMNKFTELYNKYAQDYNPSLNCKNVDIHSILIKENKKCPLRCGLKLN